MRNNVKQQRPPTDRGYVDTEGARLLAARIRAGVRVGSRIELVSVAEGVSRVHPGDRGVVRAIADDGDVVVYWDRGFVHQIDPLRNRIRPAA